MTGRTRHDNLVDILRRWARETPDGIAFRFLSRFGEEVEELSFSGLYRDSLRIAGHLAPVTAQGDRIALIFADNADFVRAFFGCICRGAVPVPALPPSPRAADRASSIVSSCSPRAVLTSRRMGDLARHRLDGFSLRRPPAWLHLEDALADDVGDLEPRRPNGDDTAFVQYTSGSTTAPRGVALSHGNLVHNCMAGALGFGFDRATLRPVSWLPLFHDMGLVGHVIVPICFGVTSTLMPTLDFLQRPRCWLAALSEYRGTFSLAPNFAYDLCADRVADDRKLDLDLSSWRWAGNGSEPVRLRTMERFARSFARCGFGMESFFPCYGLAEATLFAAGGPRGAAPVSARFDRGALRKNRAAEVGGDAHDAVTLVSCGHVRRDSDARIVDPDSLRACGDMEVGEIWLKGPSVAGGYLNEAEESARTFGGRLDGEGPFLRTGDLGFFKDGLLFVCGRMKDVIILNGLNHHPQDLERSVEGCHEAMKGGTAAAFAVDVGDREALIMTCEIRRRAVAGLDRAAVQGAMRERLSADHGVRLSEAVFLQEGSTPRTTSGKVRRSECRRLYEGGALRTV
jgi:acyl-CoA synthetase (AMP-forming)/AMP-acid ligase II